MLSFICTDSLIHRLDARLKILALLLLSSTLLIKSNPTASLLILTLTLIVYIVSKIPLTQLILELKITSIFVILPLLIHILTGERNLLLGMLSSLTLLNLFLLNFIVIHTTEIKQITQALLFFKLPKKLVFALSISLHFIPIMQKRFEMMHIAQTLRGYKLNVLASPIPLLVPMLHFSFKKSKELALSLDCRGFDENSIQIESELKMRRIDYISLVLLFALLFLVFSL